MSIVPNQNPASITCSMCGHHFNPAEHIACAACPLQGGCQLVCCPACGYEMVDPSRSGLARLVKGWLWPDKQQVEDHSIQRSLPR